MEAATSAMACRPADGARGSGYSRAGFRVQGAVRADGVPKRTARRQAPVQATARAAPARWWASRPKNTQTEQQSNQSITSNNQSITQPTRGALAVDGVHRHAGGEAGQEHGDAALVGALGGGAHHAAKAHVAHGLR